MSSPSERIALRVDRLKSLREQRGVSQRELARACGLGDTQINKYENSLSDPSSTHLMMIAKELGVSTDYLLGLTDDPHIQIREPSLDDNERTVLETYRREGWAGVARVSVAKLTEQ